MDLNYANAASYDELAQLVATETYKLIETQGRKYFRSMTPDLATACKAYLQRPGKALRPLLLVLSAMAAGEKDFRRVIPACAAVEVYHTATLVHDDIIDQDELRRGKPTVHALIRQLNSGKKTAAGVEHYAESTALLAGDILFGFSAYLLGNLKNYAPNVVLSCINSMSTALTPALIHGEQLDMELENRPISKVTAKEVEQMMLLKTSVLLAYAVRLGVTLGIGKDATQSDLYQHLADGIQAAGIAFQLQDDILGMFGDESQLGKPIGSDLREGKRTLLIVEAWKHASQPQKRIISQNLGHQDMNDETLTLLRNIVRDTGALDAVSARAEALIQTAESSLEFVSAPAVRNLLTEFIHRLTRRTK